MKKILLFISASFLFSYLSCLQEENPFKYPKVSTNPISEITPSGARFSANVEFENMDQISEFGFVWGEDSKLSGNTYSIPKDSLNGKTFYTDIRSSLKDQKLYYVRSFVKNSGKTVFGNIVSFKSLGSEGPKITSVTPQVVAFGDSLKISGRNFSSNAVVKYGYRDISSSVYKSEKNAISLVLPDSLPVNPPEDFISVSIDGNISRSPQPLKLDMDRILPKIISITPMRLKGCDTITIKGKNLIIKNRSVKVSSNMGSLTILKATKDSIVCVLGRIPDDELILYVENSRYFTSSGGIDLIEERPEITSVSPEIYQSGDILTFKVRNFPQCDNSLIALHPNGEHLKILSRTKDEMQVQLPEGCWSDFFIIFQFNNNSSNAQAYATPLILAQPPEILSIEPSHGSLGDIITIKGSRLKGASVSMLDTISTSDTEIKGRLNEFARVNENGFTDVGIYSCGSLIKENGFKYDAVEVSDFNPKTVTSPAQQIIITGKNFSSTQNKVTIGSYEFYLPSTDRQTLTVSAAALMPYPDLSVHDNIPITVENSMGISGISSISLEINYEASWKLLNDFPFDDIYLGISFSIGDKGYVGGTNSSSNFWQYDPNSETWEEKAKYPGHAERYRITTTANGKAYVGIGLNYPDEWWEYDPIADIWTKKKDYPGSSPSGGFAFGLGDKVYINTGNLELWEYNPTMDSWTRKADVPFYNVRGTFGFGFKGKGYLYATSPNGSQYENVYSPISDSWTSRFISYFERSSNNNYMIFDDYVVVGGESLDNFGENAFLKIVPGSGDFEPADYAGIFRKGPIGFAIGNYGYWGLGINSNGYQLTREIWRFDPSRFK